MATRQIQVTNPLELMDLLASKAKQIAMHINNAPFPDTESMGREIARMNELNLALKEALAALPKQSQPAQEGKRA